MGTATTGGGGDAAAVTVANGGLIMTTGDDSHAILAQSIGDGGGDGALAVTGAFTGTGLGLELGAHGPLSGAGGTVLVTNTATGSIETTGFHADGMLAQSIGGGGGDAGVGIGGAVGPATTVLVDIGGIGSTGNGGAIGVGNAAMIVTKGNFSDAVAAQSIGGGGGDAAFDFGGTVGSTVGLLAILGGEGIIEGNGGQVTMVNSGALGATGIGSNGLLAQSVGGGGGRGGFAGSVDANLAAAVVSGIDVGGSVGLRFGGRHRHRHQYRGDRHHRRLGQRHLRAKRRRRRRRCRLRVRAEPDGCVQDCAGGLGRRIRRHAELRR